jgi:predicted nuclease of predicted toxin-antitoxin system
MRYFCDRNLGRKIPQALKERGIDVITHDDVFKQNTGDNVWLIEAGRQGWTVITKDDFIRFKADERTALLTHNVGCFVLMRRNDTAQQLIAAIEVAWQRIEEISVSEQRPFIYAIYKDGSIYKRDLPEL